MLMIDVTSLVKHCNVYDRHTCIIPQLLSQERREPYGRDQYAG